MGKAVDFHGKAHAALRGALAGVTAVLVAPFRDGTISVDARATEQLVASLDSAGIHALTILGNTGEVFQLDDTERRDLLRAAASGRQTAVLIAGITGASADALRLADEAAKLGYDAVMLHDPPDPLAGESGLVSFMTEFANQSPLPTVLYLRTPRLGPLALAELAAHERVIAVKYARHDLAPLATLLADPDTVAACTWVCGLAESMVLPMRGLGVVGFTSGVANIRPDLALAVWRASRDGDFDALRESVGRLLPFEDLRTKGGGRHNVAVVKEALRRTGLEVGQVRPPCEQLDSVGVAELDKVLAAWPPDPRSLV